jgi:exodeoxyribonuclease-5
MTVIAQFATTNCAACGRPLTDALSIELAIGPDCRQQYGYNPEAVPAEARTEANTILHDIATNTLTYVALRSSMFRLHTLGFTELAKRIDQRFSRRMVQQEMATAIQDRYAAMAPPEPPKPVVLPFTLTSDQERGRAMVQRCMSVRGHALAILAGFAGVGKTSMLRVFEQEYGTPTAIAPTGKAALRIREATGLNASTIHRWLYKPKEDDKTGVTKFTRRPLEEIPVTKSRLVLLDEASMVGPDVWKDVYLTCKQLDLKLVCIGDGFQLPPVQPPNAPPFSILLPAFAEGLGAERVEMTEVLRQAQGSPVIRASMALRNGAGINALRELPRAEYGQIPGITVATHQNGGVTICHRNQTRFHLNAGIRATLGIYNEMPQVGEPLLVMKNNYDAGLMNGETFTFEGWDDSPEGFERVTDRWKGVHEDTRFGATHLGGVPLTLSLEELHGRLTVGQRGIVDAANRWARVNNHFTAGDTVAPHIHANFGYAWTAHKSQGSQWPWVFIVVEPSVRFDEEEGRRWTYTAITRAQEMAAVYIGKLY